MNKPQPQILVIWRIILTLTALIPAFLVSLLLRVGSNVWMLLVSGLVLLYLSMYLVYLPLLYKKTSFGISGEKVVLVTGSLNTRVIAIPLSQIQFTTVARSVLDRLFGISTVVVTAAGGRIAIPGLNTADADNFVLALRQSGANGGE